MAWIDPQWELDPNEDAKRMGREHPAPDTTQNRTLNRVGLIVGLVTIVLFVGGAITVAVYLL
jgi:hypothetical protein